MSILFMTFGIPFLIGLSLGFVFKNSLNRYEKRKSLDRHINSLYKE
jgi:hypothetical protein